jgi:RNA polymerase sigma-70 factor (ECF subfamily)
MDATITLWECRDHWEKDSNLPALLLTILKRKCLNYLNHEKLKDEVKQEITDLYQRELNLRISTLQECSPEKIFNKEIQHVVDATLELLPEQSRRIFTMSRFEHLSNKDIAEALGLSIKTVEFHITKVLKVMRVALKDYLFTLII